MISFIYSKLVFEAPTHEAITRGSQAQPVQPVGGAVDP